MANKPDDKSPEKAPEEFHAPAGGADNGLYEFRQIAAGVAQAGLVLANCGAGDPARRLRTAAGHIALLGFYRDSFPAAANELRAAADGIEGGHATLGFTVLESLLQVPSRDLVLEALGGSDEADDAEAALKRIDGLREAASSVRHALRQLDKAIAGPVVPVDAPLLDLEGFPHRGLIAGAPGLADASTTVLGGSLVHMADLLARWAELLISFRFLGLCPKDECETAGLVECKLDSLRVHVPVRQFSEYATSDTFRLGGGKVAEVIDALADRLLEFLKTGQVPKEVQDALKALLGGAGLKAIVENWLKGKIGIDAVVAWIMQRVGPLLGGPAAAALAGAIFVALSMAVMTVAVAKLYKQIITQPVARGVLICARISYTMCVDTMCYKKKVAKTIDLRITPRSVGIFDTGSDLWLGQELGMVPEDLVAYQYLLDLIARLSTALAGESDPLKKLELQARKQAAEDQLKAMKKARDFMKDLAQKAETAACRALRDGDDAATLERHNFKPCG